HVRDLPERAADVPKSYKGESWANLCIDVANAFKPLYGVNHDKRDQIRTLKSLLADADELYLATDEDREGEAIAWHLLEVLNPSVPVKRMVFHEITPGAIASALEDTRDLDRRLVDAQETRRLLDRLYGYELSPVLWKMIAPKLSAGRVQSVATRIVVERERERRAFRPADYWDITAELATETLETFTASVLEVDGRRVATGRDFGSDGAVERDDTVILEAEAATRLAVGLTGQSVTVDSVESKPYRRRPAAPFTTSTFQQEAGRKLRLSATLAMHAAQNLYQEGYITYMRTDSTTLSDTAVSAARAEVTERFGVEFLPDDPRIYNKKVRNAQEAHEAIRPAGDRFRHPDAVASEVPKSEARVYEMVWQRTVASQMTDALGDTAQVRMSGRPSDGPQAILGASGTVITHQGFRRAYVEETDEGSGDETRESVLPEMAAGDQVMVTEATPEGHATQPPARFTEASLVKRLEELGVGRPSTYASIMETIQGRDYVWKKGSALVPTLSAFAVVTLLEEHFPNLIDYEFTARMEADLDGIASGISESVPWLHGFYFGTGDDIGLHAKVTTRLGDIDPRAVSTLELGVTADGEEVVARYGKFGPYVQAGERTASIPDDLPPDELTVEVALDYLDAPTERRLGDDPETGLPVLARSGRFGPYVSLGEVTDDGPRPKTVSLFATMTLERITLDDALQLLSLPRTVGVDPADGVEITVQNGRYGPYLKKDKESRSLDNEEQLLTVTLDECLALLAQAKRRGRGAARPALRELGEDPASGKTMVLKDGQWGPYVTDGEYNASLRKGDSVEELTDDRAAELLAERRAKGPAKKARKKKPAAKG
ncbi:MAG: type I DNA topoisomerase, partial [Acidimicrobiales bacterium]|nr:type I DNA topoisomerase [Acidimicrobiales bacterium]